MKLAVMQPYLFPYMGYFQLIFASDLFLIFDDVNYISRGYINRNVVLSSRDEVRFTVPVLKASRNKKICELEFSTDVGKVLKTIEYSYSNAPYFKVVFPIVEQVLKSEDRSISSICMRSYQDIFSYLGVRKELKKTSEINYDRDLVAQERIISLCRKFDADCYVNAPGGRALYSKYDFSKAGVDLKFINPCLTAYPQGRKGFVAGLSIIDILMWQPQDKINEMLRKYDITS